MSEDLAKTFGTDDVGDSTTLQEVEEMHEGDLAIRVKELQARHNPALYAFCFYPSVDIVHLLMDLNILPSSRPEVAAAQWLADPRTILRQPRVLPEVLGHDRWKVLEPQLLELANDLNEVSPLVRSLKRRKLPAKEWLPFLRQLAVDQLVGSDRSFLPSMELSVCNGRLPASFGLPKNSSKECVDIATELFMGAACEAGVLKIGTTASHIRRLNNIPSSYAGQKLLMVAMSANGRRELDWEARTNGALTEAVIEWRKIYLPQVEKDLEALASGQTATGLDDDEDAEDDDDEDGVEGEDGVVAKKPVSDDEDMPIMDGKMTDPSSGEEVVKDGPVDETGSGFIDPSSGKSSRVSSYFAGAGDRTAKKLALHRNEAARKNARRGAKGEKQMLQMVSQSINKRKEGVRGSVRGVFDSTNNKSNKKTTSKGANKAL
eukprot:TRINITY_DN15063_c0_g1_i3.p1 TRINITY_DN15063_c0_g1~~TRINITY_DN15063_c0_g1_i3.p1  ORF type:complete len:432 (-),score=116.52 TRINITY_DN15063_c0_g1_i3:219-1514(-)